ncbi:MAG TPA: FAD-dependent monooxygenase [Pseudonocardia sp.]|nr:FAD-dependent monooxygenase [Pseudonocardia sp.]
MTVLIVGAGPTGLTLACDLARRGVPCRVIDRAPGLFVGSRAKGLQPRTLEVFDDLGVLDAVRAAGAPFPKFRLYAGHDVVWERGMLEILGAPPLPRDSATPYLDPWLIPQWRTDRILADRFAELGGTVEHDTDLTGLAQDDTGVTAQTNRGPIRADYVVGCDGGHSTVRKLLGVGFEGDTYETERTLIGDVRVDGLDGVFCHMFSRAGDVTKRVSLWHLPGSPYHQFVASMAADEVPELTLDGMRELLRERSGRTDIRLHDLRWISLYRLNVRMVQRYRTDRVLLAGDAAHVHSSASGQGLNTSVQDAYNLGWKLAAVVAGASEDLLDTYEAERIPVAGGVLGLSTEMYRRNFRTGPAPGAGQPAFHQLDITYRGGPLALDDRPDPGALRAGDRAPDGLLADGTRLFDLFRGPHCTLLAFGAADGGADGEFDIPVHRVPGAAAYDGFDTGAGTFALVRPDGHLGAVSASAATIRGYLAQRVPAAR